MLKPKSAQESFYGSYLYDRIVPVSHLLRRINQVVDFSFAGEILQDRYNPAIGRPAEDPEFLLRLCLLQYLYGDSDRQVVENARLNLAYKYFLGLAVDGDVPDYTTVSYFRVQRMGEEKFRAVLDEIVRQCIDKELVKGKRQIIDSTPVIANVSLSSLSGLVRKCRENVLKTITKQDTRIAEKLGAKELQNASPVKFASSEEGLQKEIERPVSYWTALPLSSKPKRSGRPRNSKKTWDYWKRRLPIGVSTPRINCSARWTLMPGLGRKVAPPGRVIRPTSSWRKKRALSLK